jgi:hypothetical protein
MIVDVRDYTLLPGTRDKLVERVETLFMDEQERLGATFLGSFCDADLPERYVWLRAFPDLDTRKQVLIEFYERGAMWKQNRDEVNAWFVDTDDVLLVRPIGELAAPASGASVVAMLQRLEHRPLTDGEAAAARRDVPAAIRAAGGRVLAMFATDPVENNYPRHPIRSGEHGLIWFATFAELPSIALPAVLVRRLLPIPRSRLR